MSTAHAAPSAVAAREAARRRNGEFGTQLIPETQIELIGRAAIDTTPPEPEPEFVENGCGGGDGTDECRPDGYRCAAHSADAVAEASARVQDAGLDTGARLRAEHEWRQAMVDYAATPFGKGQVAEAIKAGGYTGQTAILREIEQEAHEITRQRNHSADILSLSAMTFAASPEPERTVELARDAFGNGLTDQQEQWLINQIRTAREETAAGELSGGYRGRFEEQFEYVWSEDVPEADAVVASPDSTDAELAEAAGTFDVCRRRLSDDPLDADAVVGHETLGDQIHRALDHPNAGLRTLHKLLPIVGADRVLTHPACPDELFRRECRAGYEPDYEPATWNAIQERAQHSVAANILIATHHPAETCRDDAVSILAASRWAELSDSEIHHVTNLLWGRDAPRTSSMSRDAARSYVEWTTTDEGFRFTNLARQYGLDELAAMPDAPEPRMVKRRGFFG